MSGARMQHSHIGMSQANLTVGPFGAANNASNQLQLGIGSFSTAGGGSTASIPLANVSSSVSHVAPYIQLMRIA
jgi:hypothetical protein